VYAGWYVVPFVCAWPGPEGAYCPPAEDGVELRLYAAGTGGERIDKDPGAGLPMAGPRGGGGAGLPIAPRDGGGAGLAMLDPRGGGGAGLLMAGPRGGGGAGLPIAPRAGGGGGGSGACVGPCAKDDGGWCAGAAGRKAPYVAAGGAGGTAGVPRAPPRRAFVGTGGSYAFARVGRYAETVWPVGAGGAGIPMAAGVPLVVGVYAPPAAGVYALLAYGAAGVYGVVGAYDVAGVYGVAGTEGAAAGAYREGLYAPLAGAACAGAAGVVG
jgi:hypothetical protein